MGGAGWRYAWGRQDDALSAATIVRAVELGINWIDTAPVYGVGHAERLVGRTLASTRVAAAGAAGQQVRLPVAAAQPPPLSPPHPCQRVWRGGGEPAAAWHRPSRPVPDPLAGPGVRHRRRLGVDRAPDRAGQGRRRRRLQPAARRADPAAPDAGGMLAAVALPSAAARRGARNCCRWCAAQRRRGAGLQPARVGHPHRNLRRPPPAPHAGRRLAHPQPPPSTARNWPPICGRRPHCAAMGRGPRRQRRALRHRLGRGPPRGARRHRRRAQSAADRRRRGRRRVAHDRRRAPPARER